MTFWQVPNRGEKLRFRLQVDKVTDKSYNKICNTFKEWSIVSEGYNYKKNYSILVFSKEFEDREDAREFVKKFPEPLEVKGYNGKEIKHF